MLSAVNVILACAVVLFTEALKKYIPTEWKKYLPIATIVVGMGLACVYGLGAMWTVGEILCNGIIASSVGVLGYDTVKGLVK